MSVDGECGCGRVAAVVEKEIKNTFRNSRATDQLNVLVDFYVFPILSPLHSTLLHKIPLRSLNILHMYVL